MDRVRARVRRRAWDIKRPVDKVRAQALRTEGTNERGPAYSALEPITLLHQAPAGKPITPRQAYLLRWCIVYPGRSMLRLSPFGTWNIHRAAEHYRPMNEKNPSGIEGRALIERGLVTLRIDYANRMINTETGEETPAWRAVITPKGRAALAAYDAV